MIAASLMSAPRRLNHAFLFTALIVAAYPLWHAYFPVTASAVAETAIPQQLVVPPMPGASEARESAPAVTERMGACRG